MKNSLKDPHRRTHTLILIVLILVLFSLVIEMGRPHQSQGSRPEAQPAETDSKTPRVSKRQVSQVASLSSTPATQPRFLQPSG